MKLIVSMMSILACASASPYTSSSSYASAYANSYSQQPRISYLPYPTYYNPTPKYTAPQPQYSTQYNVPVAPAPASYKSANYDSYDSSYGYPVKPVASSYSSAYGSASPYFKGYSSTLGEAYALPAKASSYEIGRKYGLSPDEIYTRPTPAPFSTTNNYASSSSYGTTRRRAYGTTTMEVEPITEVTQSTATVTSKPIVLFAQEDGAQTQNPPRA